VEPHVILGEGRKGPIASSVIVVASIALLGFTVISNTRVSVAAPLIGAAVTLLLGYRRLLTWRSLLAFTILVVLFIPIRRYELPSSLPFHLEPYRLVIAFIAVGWIASLLADPRVSFSRTPIDAPLLCFLMLVLLSLIANPKRVGEVQADVIKKLMFFASFFVVYYLISSVARRLADIDFMVAVLVSGGAVLACFTIIESRTGYNVFAHLHSVAPFLHDTGNGPVLTRGARLRAVASAQHPIALGAALAMLAPLAGYRAYWFRQRRWWVAFIIIVMGALATVSRTAVLMLGIIVLVFLLLRPNHVKRLWPLLLPALVAVHFALPGTLGTLRASLFPKGGLIAQQQNARVGSGRLATLGPALHREFKPNPILGEGFGTRVVAADEYVPVPNGPILDDQWLGILLETGVLGTLALVWVFARFLRRVGGVAKHDFSQRGWLLASITSSTAAFAVGMFTYDAFSFIQVTFLFFIMMGMGAALLNETAPARQTSPSTNPRDTRRPATARTTA
jgi:hypothetical protein